MNNNDDRTASIIRLSLPLSNISDFPHHFIFCFRFQNENIWLKLKTCYIKENVQDERPSMKHKVCIDIIKNDENIYMMYTNIYGASLYF